MSTSRSEVLGYHEYFKGSWWEEGEKNVSDFQQLCDLLLKQVRERAGELRMETSTDGGKV